MSTNRVWEVIMGAFYQINTMCMRIVWVYFLAGAICGCSSGQGSSSNSTQDLAAAGNLYAIAPKVINALPNAVKGQIVLFNSGTSVVNNISYALIDQSNTKAGISSSSARNCSTIMAGSQCILTLNVPANAPSGGVRLTIAVDGKPVNSASHNAANTDPFLQSPFISIESGEYDNTLIGAEAIVAHHYHKIVSGLPYIIVNGFVASSQIGHFNNIVIVDNHDNVISGQKVLSGNLGANAADLAQGDTFGILLPVSMVTGKTQSMHLQVQQVMGAETLTQQTAAYSDTVVTESGTGIVNVVPSMINLSPAHPIQIINIINSGSTALQLTAMTIDSANFTLDFVPKSLASGEVATATVHLVDSKNGNTNNANLVLTANNGTSTLQLAATAIGQNSMASNTKSAFRLKAGNGLLSALSFQLTTSNELYATAASNNVLHHILKIANSSAASGKIIVYADGANTVINNKTCVQNSDGSITIAAAKLLDNPAYYNAPIFAGGTLTCAGADALGPIVPPCQGIPQQILSNSQCSIDIGYSVEMGVAPIGLTTIPVAQIVDTSGASTNILENLEITPATTNLSFDADTYNFAPISLLGNTPQSTNQLITITNTGDGLLDGVRMSISSTNTTQNPDGGIDPTYNDDTAYFSLNSGISSRIEPGASYAIPAIFTTQNLIRLPTPGTKANYLILRGIEDYDNNQNVFFSVLLSGVINPVTVGSSGSTLTLNFDNSDFSQVNLTLQVGDTITQQTITIPQYIVNDISEIYGPMCGVIPLNLQLSLSDYKVMTGEVYNILSASYGPNGSLGTCTISNGIGEFSSDDVNNISIYCGDTPGLVACQNFNL